MRWKVRRRRRRRRPKRINRKKASLTKLNGLTRLQRASRMKLVSFVQKHAPDRLASSNGEGENKNLQKVSFVASCDAKRAVSRRNNHREGAKGNAWATVAPCTPKREWHSVDAIIMQSRKWWKRKCRAINKHHGMSSQWEIEWTNGKYCNDNKWNESFANALTATKHSRHYVGRLMRQSLALGGEKGIIKLSLIEFLWKELTAFIPTSKLRVDLFQFDEQLTEEPDTQSHESRWREQDSFHFTLEIRTEKKNMEHRSSAPTYPFLIAMTRSDFYRQFRIWCDCRRFDIDMGFYGRPATEQPYSNLSFNWLRRQSKALKLWQRHK